MQPATPWARTLQPYAPQARRDASQGGPPSPGLRGPPPLPGGAVRLPAVLAEAARLGDEETLRRLALTPTPTPT